MVNLSLRVKVRTIYIVNHAKTYKNIFLYSLQYKFFLQYLFIMSKKSRPTDNPFLKNKHTSKPQNKSTKKTNDCHGFTEKSRKMVKKF